MIDHAQVKKIADLARLTLNESEIAMFSKQLTDILDYAESLKTLDVNGIKPTAHAVDVDNVFREDETRDAGVIARTMERAPKADEGYFLVPKVL